MGADVDSDVFGNRCHLGKKVDQVLLQPFAIDAVIGAQFFDEFRQVKPSAEPGRPAPILRDSATIFASGISVNRFCGSVQQPVGIILCCVRALENVYIKGSEIV